MLWLLFFAVGLSRRPCNCIWFVAVFWFKFLSEVAEANSKQSVEVCWRNNNNIGDELCVTLHVPKPIGTREVFERRVLTFLVLNNILCRVLYNLRAYICCRDLECSTNDFI